jgi:hypothetical protein
MRTGNGQNFDFDLKNRLDILKDNFILYQTIKKNLFVRILDNSIIDQSMIINFEMKKIFGGEAKQNPLDST